MASRPDHDLVQRLRNHGVGFNEATVAVGLTGPGIYERPILSVGEAAGLLLSEEATGGLSAASVEAAVRLDGSSNRAAAVGVLLELAHRNNRSLAWETRKWRAAELEALLESLGNDPVEALTALTEFWAAYDYPDDSPHVVQGRSNPLSPSEYYTESTLERLRQAHSDWLKPEWAAIAENDAKDS